MQLRGKCQIGSAMMCSSREDENEWLRVDAQEEVEMTVVLKESGSRYGVQ